MTALTQKTLLLRIGSAKALTRSVSEGDLKEAFLTSSYYI